MFGTLLAVALPDTAEPALLAGVGVGKGRSYGRHEPGHGVGRHLAEDSPCRPAVADNRQVMAAVV